MVIKLFILVITVIVVGMLVYFNRKLLAPFVVWLTAPDDNPLVSRVAREREKLAGLWDATSGEKNGQPLPKETVQEIKLYLVGQHYTLRWADRRCDQGTYQIILTEKPKSIDFMPTMGGDQGKRFLGIYQVDRGILKLCYVEPGMERPIDYTAGSRNDGCFYVFQRDDA